ncbi:T9SS type A sorting domain-containing protein [Aquimarina sp. 2304DJ70-9]|uniref:T9SS type A sorting domain-containing protein n=1 Tax=Aquimarina penaris TaxID=3231044 RepID=UPI003462B006
MKYYKNDSLKMLFVACLTLLASTTMLSQTVFVDVSNQIPQVPPNGTDTVDSDLVDVDGDGDLDIFLAEGTASIAGRANRLLLNDGYGNFVDASQSNLPFSPFPLNSTSADFADFDNDGDMDIVVANLGPTQLLLNDGDGIFTDASNTLLPTPPTNILDDISTEISFEDIDNDGRLDIFVTNEIPPIPDIGPGGSQNFLYMQSTDGTFTDESLLRLPNVKNQSASFAFGDIDGDGNNDLIVANVGQNQVLINDGNGFFINETETRITQEITASRSVVLSDIDGDFDLDLIIANSNLEQNQVFINDAKGFFTENTTNALPLKNDTSSDVKLFDFNFDRQPDIIFANSVPNPMGPANGGHPLAPAPNVVYLNNGAGIFTDASSEFLPENEGISFDIEIADINGDRLEDIFVSNANDGQEQLYIRDIIPPTQFERIIPFTSCLVENEDGTLTATFGYSNLNDTAVYIPEGTRNKLIPNLVDSKNDQPVIFLQGTINEVFTATFNVGMAWKVNNKITIASSRTPKCNNDNASGNSILSIGNYPNPFSTTTTIKYTLSEISNVKILIYDQSGKTIETISNLSVTIGEHEIEIDATALQLKPGVYFYKITTGKHKAVKSFVVNR